MFAIVAQVRYKIKVYGINKPKFATMEPGSQKWIVDPTVLVKFPDVLQLWPRSDMTAIERSNATARITIVFTVMLFVLYPQQKYYMLGLGMLGYLWYVNANRRAAETFDAQKVRAATETAVKGADAPLKEAPPIEQKMAEKLADVKQLESMAQRGADIKRKYIEEVFNDDKQKALGFMRNARETNPRGEVVWSDEQRIYGNRNYVRPSTDEYDDLFYGDVGMFKFLSRRT